MKIPRISMLTLGVADLKRAAKFYESVLKTPLNLTYEGVVFIELPGTWLALYPLENLAGDISAQIHPSKEGFSGITLAHNGRSRDEVLAVIERARSAGARIVKEPRETSWGGFGGYFSDLDGYHWEVAWGPMFDFTEKGELKFKDKT
ncbi:VOC family protein [Desulfospira joergensenii]|uniref:VOC family protein n=1 Tax=Desulfospira joergensenii TaxID=53329 RepID=UPI0003B766ED|nr:VOC family protein [Desulfospira joergensenii]